MTHNHEEKHTNVIIRAEDRRLDVCVVMCSLFPLVSQEAQHCGSLHQVTATRGGLDQEPISQMGSELPAPLGFGIMQAADPQHSQLTNSHSALVQNISAVFHGKRDKNTAQHTQKSP